MRSDSCHLLGPMPPHCAGGDLADFWRPDIAPLAGHVRDALLAGAKPPELLHPARDAAALEEPGYQPIETGWTITPARETRVFCRTSMPGVTPEMLLWWMAWHGSDPARYRLWHPQAHVSALWADGKAYDGTFVGRTSLVTEYLGSSLAKIAIRFTPPAAVGLDEAGLRQRGEGAICARVGLQAGGPEASTMIHHLRPTSDGCEMRSRFWIMGDNLAVPSLVRPVATRLAGLVNPVGQERAAEALLVHCAEEMGHLATFLPELYHRFGGR